MKMGEILIVTEFFDNITTEVVIGFHICEAPGNFVASILYLLGDKYRWHAQSLKDGVYHMAVHKWPDQRKLVNI